MVASKVSGFRMPGWTRNQMVFFFVTKMKKSALEMFLVLRHPAFGSPLLWLIWTRHYHLWRWTHIQIFFLHQNMLRHWPECKDVLHVDEPRPEARPNFVKPFFVWRTGSGGRRGSSRSRPHPASPKQHPETKDNLNNGHENTIGTEHWTFKERNRLVNRLHVDTKTGADRISKSWLCPVFEWCSGPNHLKTWHF